MNQPRHVGGRVSTSTFVLRFLPLAQIEIDPLESNAPQAAIRCKLTCGVEIAGFQCGVFLFDCQDWLTGTSVEIPRVPIEDGEPMSPNYIAADEKAIEHVVNRVQMANCFLACLSNAISRVQKTGLGIGQEVDPSNYIPVALSDRNPLSLTANEVEHLMRTLQKPRPTGDPTITLHSATIRHACKTLDVVLASAELIQIVDLYYKACFRYSLHDSALAATIAWTICEKTLNTLWTRHLDSVRSDTAQSTRINADRIKKLTGRDFTASIVSEALELLGVLETELYADLNRTRQVRNSWMHSLEYVTDQEAVQAITTAYKMLLRTYNVDILVQLSRGMTY